MENNKKKELLIFFTTNNKNGFKTSEKYFKSNFPKLYDEMVVQAKRFDCTSFKEVLYLFLNDMKEKPNYFYFKPNKLNRLNRCIFRKN